MSDHSKEAAPRAGLAALLSPRVVAVVGASPDPSILRGRTLKVMRAHAFAGRIYPVSRRHAEVQGLAAFPSVADIPEPVDLAVLIIPAAEVPAELERCAQAGVRAVLVLASGFAEEPAGAGAALQARIAEIARRRGIVVCGPNSEGFANLATGLCPTFSPVLEGPQPAHAGGARLAVVSQSGGVGFSFLDRGRPRGLAFSHVVTTGNEACLDCFDVVEHLLDEGEASVFLLFLEAIRNAATFRRVAARALAAGKPIVVSKIGASEAGRRAAASHTGALAGEHEVYRALFRRYGVIECADADAMLDVAAGFARYGDRLPAGRRVGIATASGGAGGWLADACAAEGLELPELEPAARARIDAHLPSYGSSRNPVDGTAQAVRTLGYAELARMVSLSERVDAVVSVVSARSSETLEKERERLASLARESVKPVLVWSYTLPAAESARVLAEAGLPLYTSMRGCARALAAMAAYRARREQVLRTQAAPPAPDPARAARVATRLKAAAARAAGGALAEHEAAALLAEYGVRTPAARLATSEDEAAAAAAALGSAVALKVQSSDLPHKTDAGAVALGVAGEAAVREAHARILAAARRHAPRARIDGVLVQRMAPPGREMIAGIKVDPTFGPMVLAGFGGVDVETLRDAALAPLPLGRDEARELVDSLRGRALLEGTRGRPPADVDAFVELLVALGAFAADHAERIAEVDLNPVLLHARGEGATAVDALIVPRVEAPARD